MSDGTAEGDGSGSGTSTAQAAQVTTSSQTAHNHGIGSESRAVVVGKSLNKATGANQVIEVLVDIAG